MLSYMQHHLFVSDRLIIINTPHHNWYLAMNQILLIFEFLDVLHVPVAPPQRTKMGPQIRLGIYVGFDSPSVIRYLEPMTGDLFTTRFADYPFDETNFVQLGERKKNLKVKLHEKFHHYLISIHVLLCVNRRSRRSSICKTYQIK